MPWCTDYVQSKSTMTDYPCPECGSLQCHHNEGQKAFLWEVFWERLGVNDSEKASLILMIQRLMSGGVLGDGIGPGNSAREIHRTLGYSLSETAVWAIWRERLTDAK